MAAVPDLEIWAEREDTGLKYYNIPAGTHLYKSMRNYPDAPLPGDLSFFAFVQEAAELYGIAEKYVTTAPHRLLAMDDEATRMILFNRIPSGDENSRTALKNNYGLRSGIRNSVSSFDWHFVKNFLCKEGYPGYAINNMRTDAGGHFHKEAVFCKAPSVERIGTVSSKKFIDTWISNKAYNDINNVGNKRKNKPVSVFNFGDSGVKSRRLFDDYDDESPKGTSKKGGKCKKNIKSKHRITRRYKPKKA